VNQIKLEKVGIPTVTIATTDFIDLAKTTAAQEGASNLAFVVVEHPIGAIGLESVQKKAKEAFPEIMKMATEWEPGEASDETVIKGEVYPAPTIEVEGTVDDVNNYFFEKGWSNGLPIVPPTPEKVEAMLKGTDRSPDEEVWVVPPRNGILTVEGVATYAVMTGCKPEYMPILLSALDAMKDPGFNWRGLTTTTHPNGLLVVVNGPIAKELGIASGIGAASGFSHPNMAIGYALALMTDVVGGSTPQTEDKTQQGWVGNAVATVVAESENSPWESFSEEQGFSADDNIVTVFAGGPPTNIQDHTSPGNEGLLRVFANTINNAGQNTTCASNGQVVLLISEEHAQLMAEEGWTKEKLQDWLWENSQRPAKEYADKCADWASEYLGKEVGPDTNVPIVGTPEQIRIIVSGGAGKHSQYWGGFQHFKSPKSQEKTVISIEIE
jgi:hypothetical protein